MSESSYAWSPENVAFWTGAREGRLLFKRCGACGKPHYYPRARCPLCGGLTAEWESASGIGLIYSFSIVRRADPIYVPAYVTLEEGLTMLTNVVDCNPESLYIGQKVRVVFRTVADGRQAPMFTPVVREGIAQNPSSPGVL